MNLNFREGNRFNALRELVDESVKNGIAQDDCLTAVKVMCQVIGYEESDTWIESFVGNAYANKPIDITIEATTENCEKVIKALNGEFGQDAVIVRESKKPIIVVNVHRAMSAERAERFRFALGNAFPEGYLVR